jgi:hypothetical protein
MQNDDWGVSKFPFIPGHEVNLIDEQAPCPACVGENMTCLCVKCSMHSMASSRCLPTWIHSVEQCYVGMYYVPRRVFSAFCWLVLVGGWHRTDANTAHTLASPTWQVVGVVKAFGSQVKGLQLGQRVGAGWIRDSCRRCPACLRGEENICDLVGR